MFARSLWFAVVLIFVVSSVFFKLFDLGHIYTKYSPSRAQITDTKSSSWSPHSSFKIATRPTYTSTHNLNATKNHQELINKQFASVIPEQHIAELSNILHQLGEIRLKRFCQAHLEQNLTTLTQHVLQYNRKWRNKNNKSSFKSAADTINAGWVEIVCPDVA